MISVASLAAPSVLPNVQFSNSWYCSNYNKYTLKPSMAEHVWPYFHHRELNFRCFRVNNHYNLKIQINPISFFKYCFSGVVFTWVFSLYYKGIIYQVRPIIQKYMLDNIFYNKLKIVTLLNNIVIYFNINVIWLEEINPNRSYLLCLSFPLPLLF